MLQYLGLVCVIGTWIIMGVLMWRWYDPTLKTISQHVARHRSAYVMFVVGVGLVPLVYYVWMLVWMMPHLGLGWWYGVVATIAIVLQVISALVPADKNRQPYMAIHDVAAKLMGISYLPMMWMIAFAPYISDIAQVITVVLSGVNSVLAVYFMLTWERQRHVVMWQATYIVIFQLIMLIAAYL